ncbi:maestro heat-like repeat-containing protein family member 7 [Dromaius novaehollandiae]|uniref:maestro heat-like repeat-containing protein family member 7 n=1 Tax=Dromaius novaehollandiae TaxID=8790 RepID=UPI00311FF022
MAERPPSRPRVAWQEQVEEAGVLAESSSQPQPHEGCVPQALLMAPSLALPREEAEALEHLHAFLSHRGKEEAEKLRFLASVCTLCTAASSNAWLREQLWLCRLELAETLEVLLQEEPSDHMGSAVRQQVMLAISAMRVKQEMERASGPTCQDCCLCLASMLGARGGSPTYCTKVHLVPESENNSLLHACFCSVFSLPPREDAQSLNASLYSKTLDAMDSMLQVLVLSCPASQLLEMQIILKVLLPFTESKQAAARVRAVGRIARLVSSSLLQAQHHFEETSDSSGHGRQKHFPILGQLVGCLTLCCAYEEQGTSDRAAAALRHLCRFILREESREQWPASPEHLQLQKDWEAINAFCLSQSSDARQLLTVVGKYLQPSESTDVIVMAIRAMRACSAYDTQAAAHMLDVLVTEDACLMEHVPKIVRCIWRSVLSITEVSARLSLDRALLKLTCTYPEDVVMTLLRCCPSCDSAAAAMWRLLVSKPEAAERVLQELLSVLEDWPLHEIFTSDGDDTDVFSLAATRALHEILQQSSYLQEVEAFFHQLFLVLLFQISFTTELSPEEAEIWRECQGEESALSSAVRFTVQTMKALLCCVGYEAQVLLMERKRGWDLLLSTETLYRGVGLLAREMRKTSSHLRAFMLQRLTELLRREEALQEIPAMAFLVELLACGDLCGEDEDVLVVLGRYLQSRCGVMRGLVLRGLVLLCEREETVRRMHFLVPLLMEQLQDVDRDIGTKALVVLSHVVHVMARERVAGIALQLLEKLLPLFDDEPRHVRELSIHLFKDVMEAVVGSRDKQVKEQVHRSLLPLVFHLHDEILNVAQASQEALLGAAKFLKWEQLGHLTAAAQTWRIGECLLARDSRRAGEYLRHSLSCLQSPQEPLREAAVRFTGLAGQCLRGRSKEKLEDICKALQGLEKDISPSISSLATQTILLLRAPGTGGTHQGLCYRLRRAWERWHRPWGAGRVCCWSSPVS